MAYVSRAGSLGVDRSINSATVPMTGYVLLLTIAVNARRNYMEVQNQSLDLLQLVRDDGAGANLTSIMLTGAALAGGQGAGWTSDTFKGRVRVYGPNAGAQVGAYED